jgi:2-polyprenyl-6-methoxyphenol hydroxylase-like FAD-dependent oxidoreductase
MMTSVPTQDVVVVGAGPVGVVCALALARQGLRVTLIEAEAGVDRAPRAATTHPATLEMLADLGLVNDVIRQGLVARTFQFWDRVTGEKVAEFDHKILAQDTRFPFVVQCEQHKIANIGIERLSALTGTTVMMGARVVGFVDHATAVTIEIEKNSRTSTARARYLVGCDGGRSAVRKQLGIAFEGYTHPERFLVLTTPFDFTIGRGVCLRNYFSDPDEWANLFKVSGDDGQGVWRVVFPTRLDETDEEACSDEAVQRRLRKFFPRGEPYEVIHRNLYKVHQRVAASFHKGSVFLAGDAAHVNNPIGGLGMNFGIHDAVDLATWIGSVVSGREPEGSLAEYDRIRRPLNVEFVQQQTIQNKKRLEERDPIVRRQNFLELAATASDPVRHRQFLLRTSLIESVRKASSNRLSKGGS